MKRITWIAVYSAGFSVISVSLYITLYGAATAISGGHHVSARSLTEGFLMIAPLGVIPAAVFGLTLGLAGGWILSCLPIQITSRRFVPAVAVLGGVLGCVPPIVFRLIQHEDTPFGFLPCISIGILCAGSWAMLWLRRDRVGWPGCRVKK
jgi:hypothetical protein